MVFGGRVYCTQGLITIGPLVLTENWAGLATIVTCYHDGLGSSFAMNVHRLASIIRSSMWEEIGYCSSLASAKELPLHLIEASDVLFVVGWWV